MNTRILLAAALLAPALATAQQVLEEKKQKPAAKAAPAKPAAKGGNIATVNGVAVPQARADIIMQQQQQRGAPDNEQMRAAVREELINREVIAQEAQRAGMANSAEVKAQLDIVRQEIIVGAYLRDYARKHPVTEAEIQKEYDRAKAQHGDKEYKARHILVETEDQAKSLIAELKKGAKFDDLASKNSKDTGSAQRGGDLDWNVPGTFDKMFSDAMVKLEKGKYSEAPVKTRFGFHIIQLDDVRPAKFAALGEVRPRIQQMLVQNKIDELIKGLRAKAKIE
ncbi:MAG TPA: peptidylprolyl isomerase [Burkholderiales bacterium]|nr:peptidylprolyl isomerase [Burkholderiales bacterium]